MIPRIHRSHSRLWGVSLLVALAAAASAPRAVRAQTTLNADAGLDHYYKAQRWFPVRVNLAHQGDPAKIEVRARFTQGLENAGEYRIPARELRAGANEQRTLYVRAPLTFSTQPLLLELYRDGRLVSPVRPVLNLVNDGDWLVLGIGSGNAQLKQLTTVTLTAQMAAPSTNAWQRGQAPRVNVAIQEPKDVPDQWQGLQAADMVVLGNVSERDLSPEQAGALRDYVTTGGVLVVTGGTNWNRLNTPFFNQLLPVTVTGGATLSSARSLAPLAGGSGPVGSYPATVARPKVGSEVLASEGGTPLVVRAPKGSGQVIYVAFDSSSPPFRTWERNGNFWSSLLMERNTPGMVSTSSGRDLSDPSGGYSSNSGPAKLADAPYAIPQLDIPAFYVVAVFLLAYIVILVPVNYFVLKAKDKKEYAWLTTPAIVLVFSIGAYMIGYGFKGGRTLVVKTGLVEAHAGQDAAPSLFYAGLFSPRKTSYDVRLANAAPENDSATLFSQPAISRSTPPLRSVQGDTAYVEDYAVDMWAMRVVKAEGVVRLQGGITASLQDDPIAGTIRNNSPYSLSDCYVIASNEIVRVGEVAAGQETPVSGSTFPGLQGSGFLPVALLDQIQGTREEKRMKRAVLEPLCQTNGTSANGSVIPRERLLIGWIKGPINTLDINGHAPRELAATLMVVHLGPH